MRSRHPGWDIAEEVMTVWRQSPPRGAEETMQIAGNLLWRAIQMGAFGAPKWAALRAGIEHARNGTLPHQQDFPPCTVVGGYRSPHGDVHAAIYALHWLVEARGTDLGDFFADDCRSGSEKYLDQLPYLAEVLKAEADSLTPLAGGPPDLPYGQESRVVQPTRQLLAHLKDKPNGVPVLELPNELLHADLLTVMDADRLIEFGHRNYCHAGGQLIVERGWDFVSVTGPDKKSMVEFIDDLKAARVDPRIQMHVRLTATGRVEASREALSAMGTPQQEHVLTEPSEKLRLLGMRCVKWIRQEISLFRPVMVDLLEMPAWRPEKVDDSRRAGKHGKPARVTEREANQRYGKVVRCLVAAWREWTRRFFERDRDRYYDLCEQDARRVMVLVAFTFVRDFRGLEFEVDWPWETQRDLRRPNRLEGRGWVWSVRTAEPAEETALIALVEKVLHYFEQLVHSTHALTVTDRGTAPPRRHHLSKLTTGAPAVALKPRVKRKVANPLIAEHLCRKPHDTVQEVASAVGCSTGLVSESPGWRANQLRLRDARAQNCDPIALPLQDYLSAGGENPQRQQRAHDRVQAALDDEIDERDHELFERIGEFQAVHPDASAQEIGKSLGCTAGDVERRQAILNRLTAEQGVSEREDGDAPFDEPRPRQRVRKRV